MQGGILPAAVVVPLPAIAGVAVDVAAPISEEIDADTGAIEGPCLPGARVRDAGLMGCGGTAERAPGTLGIAGNRAAGGTGGGHAGAVGSDADRRVAALATSNSAVDTASGVECSPIAPPLSGLIATAMRSSSWLSFQLSTCG